MEKSLNFFIKECFDLKTKDINTYSPLTLAYIGDAIFDVVVRSLVVDNGNMPVDKIHKKCASIVNAKSQALMAKSLKEDFTEKEEDIFRRAKNTKMNSMAKNASQSDYRNATGFEAVLGFLYLTDDMERVLFLCKKAIESLGAK